MQPTFATRDSLVQMSQSTQESTSVQKDTDVLSRTQISPMTLSQTIPSPTMVTDSAAIWPLLPYTRMNMEPLCARFAQLATHVTMNPRLSASHRTIRSLSIAQWRKPMPLNVNQESTLTRMEHLTTRCVKPVPLAITAHTT